MHPFRLLTFALIVCPVAMGQCIIAEYRMEGNAQDNSPNGYDGVVYGASGATGIYGIMNKALDFDGVTDHVILNNNQPILSSTPFVIEVVARIEGPGGGPDGAQPLFSQREDSPTGNGSILDLLANNGQGQVQLLVKTSPTSGADTLNCPTPFDGDWHCYKAIFGEDDSLRLLIDGVEVSSKHSLQNGALDVNVSHVQIGRHSYSNATRAFFNGSIEELKILTCDSLPSLCKTLQPADTSTNYPPPSGGPPPPPKEVCILTATPANVFTPNNDGVNDLFRLNFSCAIESMVIFNRWGKEVFKSAQAVWDGRTTDGKELSTGVYFYTVVTHDQVFQGVVTLIRR